MTLEEQYPATRTYCARCQREHLVRPRAYYLAKARARLRDWFAAELERRADAQASAGDR